MLCRQCHRPLAGELRVLMTRWAWWYRCEVCGISYAVPEDYGPVLDVVVVVRDFAPDLVVIGWLGVKFWCWRLWRSRWFRR